MKPLLLPLGLALTAAACPSPAPAPRGAPPSAASSAATRVAQPPSDEVADASVTSTDFALLGSACPAEPPPELACNGGVVVAIFRLVDTIHGPWPPADAESIAERPPSDDARRTSLSLGRAGERLYGRVVTCGGCRRVLGWAFAVDLAHASDGARRLVQARVGLPETPLLVSVEDYRRAFGAPREKPRDAPPGVPGECMNAAPNQPLPARCHDL